MPELAVDQWDRLKGTMKALEDTRIPWWTLWREVANFYLPYRYSWLASDKERRIKNAKNPNILDATGTMSARVLHSGMMNGITSPARPWLRFRHANFEDDLNHPARMWLDEVARRMLLVMGETNFYKSMATIYMDLVIFGTACMLIYEDDESVFRCYNSPLGEFYLQQSGRLQVNRIARVLCLTITQIEELFGTEGMPEGAKVSLKLGGVSKFRELNVHHLVEPNDNDDFGVPRRFKFREIYWVKGNNERKILSARGFNEFPAIAPRWDPASTDVYSASPAMEALGDVIQLQHMTKNKAQGVDKMHKPALLADTRLQNKPMALMPNGITYVAGLNTSTMGAKPVHEVRMPIAELTADIRDIRLRIQEIFHNPLFNMISQLETVRTATEIDARREEKLVMLGPVLERFENEALDPAISRIFSIMNRQGLIPEPPEELAGKEIEIEYVSILSAAQSAVGVVPTERFLQLIGGIAPLYPKAANIPNWDELLRDYGRELGVKAKHLNSSEEIAAQNQQADQLIEAQQAGIEGQALVEGAKTLSETDVGGGANALQSLLGG